MVIAEKSCADATTPKNNMYISNELSSKDKEIVEEFKKKFEGEMEEEMMNDNHMFLRFLRARDFQMKQAEDMLRKHLNWRKTNQIDTILTDYVHNKVITNYLPFARLGFDKEGSLIRYFGIGNADCKGILKSCRKMDLIKSAVAYFEDDVRIMNENNAKAGKSIQKWTYIVDFEGFNLSKATHKPTVDAILSLFQTYEANYPERLKVSYVINSSVYFTMLYSVLKPLLSEATANKILVYGKDGWQKDVLNLIDEDVLPEFLGGRNQKIELSSQCLHGSVVPEEYFMNRSENRISDKPDSENLTIARKSKHTLHYDVEEPGTVIEWEFESENGDVGFGLCYKENSDDELSEMKEIIPTQKVEAHILSETGMYTCTKAGTYVVVFDNTHSWINKREIYYKITVISPKEQIQV